MPKIPTFKGVHNKYIYMEMTEALSEPEASLFHSHNTGEGYGTGMGEGTGCYVGDGRESGDCWEVDPEFPSERNSHDYDDGSEEDNSHEFAYYRETY